MTEVTELEGNMNELKKEIKEMTSATKNMEKNAQTEILSDLKTIQNKMKICKTQLETLTEWDQQCASCHDALSNQDTEVGSIGSLHSRWPHPFWKTCPGPSLFCKDCRTSRTVWTASPPSRRSWRSS